MPLVTEVEVTDEAGRKKVLHIPGERPLTIFVNKQELVTLMTTRRLVSNQVRLESSGVSSIIFWLICVLLSIGAFIKKLHYS